MPVLEYACHACGNRFDKLVRGFGAPVQVPCPSCGATDVERLMSAFAVAGTGRSSGGMPSFDIPRGASTRDLFR